MSTKINYGKTAPSAILQYILGRSRMPKDEYQTWEANTPNLSSGSVACAGKIVQLENVPIEKDDLKQVLTCFMMFLLFGKVYLLPDDLKSYMSQVVIADDPNWKPKKEIFIGEGSDIYKLGTGMIMRLLLYDDANFHVFLWAEPIFFCSSVAGLGDLNYSTILCICSYTYSNTVNSSL